MSLKDRLAKKNLAILNNVSREDDPHTISSDKSSENAPKARTAPGQMMAFRQTMQDHEKAVKRLENELSQFKTSIKTIKLDTSKVDPSKWANRHSSSFESAAFNNFKDEIASAGGNIQPILVRPSGSSTDHFEIVFGHRRYTACKELGLQVLAMIIELSDEELFTLMDRENRQRQDLSPYEQGEMWRKAIDAGLFSSERKLAAHVGVSQALVNRCLVLARLPDFILNSFTSPTLIQVRWGSQLAAQVQADPEGMRERANRVKELGGQLAPAKAFEVLMGQGGDLPKLKSSPIKISGKVVGKWTRSADGETNFSIQPGVLDESQFKKLQEFTLKLLSE